MGCMDARELRRFKASAETLCWLEENPAKKVARSFELMERLQEAEDILEK